MCRPSEKSRRGYFGARKRRSDCFQIALVRTFWISSWLKWKEEKMYSREICGSVVNITLLMGVWIPLPSEISCQNNQRLIVDPSKCHLAIRQIRSGQRTLLLCKDMTLKVLRHTRNTSGGKFFSGCSNLSKPPTI